MLCYILSLFVLATLATSQTIEDCPPNLARDDYLQVYGDSCFKFVVYRKKTYEDAKSDCGDQGGTLVMIKSEDIQNFIQNQLTTTYSEATEVIFWIGLDDITKEGTYLWADGSSLTYTNWHKDGVSTQTDEMQYQDCVVLNSFTDGQWWQLGCSNFFSTRFYDYEINYSYICQYDLTQ